MDNKFTAAQLWLVSEASWGWAQRGEDPPVVEPKVPRRKLSYDEKLARGRELQALLRRAKRGDVAGDLLAKQRVANIMRAKREAEEGRGLMPPSEEETRG